MTYNHMNINTLNKDSLLVLLTCSFTKVNHSFFITKQIRIN